jgi:hypothetical protein
MKIAQYYDKEQLKLGLIEDGGLTPADDVSARDIQFKDNQIVRGNKRTVG